LAGAPDLILAAAGGAVSLALAASLWAVSVRRRAEQRLARASDRLARLEGLADATQASAEAFDSAMLTIEDGRAQLAWGGDSLNLVATVLGLDEAAAAPQAVIAALMAADADHRRRLKALIESGQPCAFQARGPGGEVAVDGRVSGAVAWLRLQPALPNDGGLPPAPRLAGLLDALPHPVWLAHGAGLIWANQAWLLAVEASSIEDAITRKLAFDRGANALVAEAAQAGERRDAERWTPVGGQRRAFRLSAQPLEGGDIGAWALDATDVEETREALRRNIEAHDETLNHLADAVAIFSPEKRLSFHNTAFAQLWGLEPAWLAEGPTHAELLDRLRQRRRLPETADYARWKADELSWYEALSPSPDDLWTLPDGRTLRVVRQPHPLGGLLVLFSDMTGELRLKSQYNALIQVQQATLDKLNDAVVVFGSDGRLRLYNDAFARFWNTTAADIDTAAEFDGIVQLCVPRLHDQQFWRELKGRVTDPDPGARIAISGETKSSDDRIIAFQSRPLPDGATLVAFADVTDTRQLEKAVADRSAALAEAERLKRDFVGNVSYELRTPLTTIIGYSELLERAGDALPERMRGHVSAVRSAASQLARSIDDVLDMAQIDAGEMALDVADVRIETLLEDAAKRWERQAEAGGVTIETACDSEVGVIRADAPRLTQCIDHLVENALMQTPPGGRVTLSAHRAPSEVQVQVSDTGRGIPFHVQAHIFDRFVGRDRGGPGLGLALVKALIELHGGWVALESEPGQGATFTCHLPETAYAGAGQTELALFEPGTAAE
jgi:signal transduction histidine kinase